MLSESWISLSGACLSAVGRCGYCEAALQELRADATSLCHKVGGRREGIKYSDLSQRAAVRP